MFFVLSGFLITFLILKEIELRGSLNVKAFYIRRFLRIWPLYYAVLLFAFFIYPFLISFVHPAPDVFGERQWYYYTFLSNFDLINITKDGLPGSFLTGVTWSVAVEEQFYLIWPLMFYFVPKKYFFWIFLLVIIICLVFRSLHLDQPAVLYFHSLSVCSDLAIGGLAAWLSINSKTFIRFFENRKLIFRIAVYLVGIIYILINGYFFRSVISDLSGRLITGVFVAWIIMDQNFCNSKSWKLSYFKTLSKWGTYTYGMYLLHQVSLLIVINGYQLFNIEAVYFFTKIIKAIIVFGLTLLLSYISYHFFEKRFLRLKNRFAYFTKD